MKLLASWKHVEVSHSVPRRRSFCPEGLDNIEADFRIMLVASDIYGKFVYGVANDIYTSLSLSLST